MNKTLTRLLAALSLLAVFAFTTACVEEDPATDQEIAFELDEYEIGEEEEEVQARSQKGAESELGFKRDVNFLGRPLDNGGPTPAYAGLCCTQSSNGTWGCSGAAHGASSCINGAIYFDKDNDPRP